MKISTKSAIRQGLVAACAVGLGGCAALGPVAPALTEADFAALRPGISQQEVLAKVGRPTWIFGVRQENLSIWNYRFNRNDCVIYQLSIRPDGTLRDAAQGYDPACDGPSGRF